MPPALAVAGVAAAGSIGGAMVANSGAKKAAKATQYAADQSAAVQREVYGQNKETLSPFVKAGLPATGEINALLGLSGMAPQQGAFDRFRNSTGYQFRLGQGMNAINSGYAGAGTLKSGAAMKAINDYGQGMAAQEFGSYLNSLGNQQALGLSAGSALAGVGQNYANSLGNIYAMNGANQANAALVRSQNTAGAINSLANLGGSILGGGGFGGGSSMGGGISMNPSGVIWER